MILVNYAANFMQDWLVSLTGEQVIFDLRRAMFAHLQYVALAFMDKTEVGRMMSRLQGDVYSLQEFLENSITAFGDLLLLFGIVAIMLWLDFDLGLLTLSVVPILFFVRLVWLPRARRPFAGPGRPVPSPMAPWPKAFTRSVPCRGWGGRPSTSISMTRRRPRT